MQQTGVPRLFQVRGYGPESKKALEVNSSIDVILIFLLISLMEIDLDSSQ